MRSPLWFVAAFLVAVAGFAASVLYVWPRFGALDALLLRAVVPGSTLLALAKPGSYTIYYERQYSDEPDMPSALRDLKVEIVNEATGARPAVTRSSVQSEYSSGGRSGKSILGFSIDQPGSYRLVGSFADGRRKPEMTLAVDSGFVGGLFRLIGVALALAFGGVGIAAVIVIVTILQRLKAKRLASKAATIVAA